MTKESYIEQEITKLSKPWMSILLLSGAATVLLLNVMDYLVFPDKFLEFFVYRAAAAVLLLALYFFNRTGKADEQAYRRTIAILAAVIPSVMIELMILSTGGHQSLYYSGIILVLIFIFGFFPASLGLTIILVVLAYLIYLLPILVFDTITEKRIFISNLFFLTSTVFVGFVWRYISQVLLTKKLALEFELSGEKKQLETYSHQLESMVTERTKELSRTSQWHQALFENATDGIVVLDRNGIIMNANDRACEMHGFSKEALVGSHSSLLEVDENRPAAAERFKRLLDGETIVYETVHYKKDGSRIQLEVSAKAIPIHDELFIQAFQRDITEKKKIQEHLFQAQKMDSIGMLAGGIAHDFNNVLTAILGYTDLIRRDVGANEKVLGRLGVIENASRKAGRMVSQLLGFSRKSEIEMVSVDINAVVHDTVKLLERVIDKRIVVRLALAESIPSFQGDINKIEQVLMNFVVNARDAMPYGGIITISTGIVDAGPGAVGVPPYVPAGRYVVFSVADTGVGIPEEIQRKIFEPFYTTKERGKGTGLGLAMVYGVVTDHKGYVTVQSKVNQGTTFTVYLPVAVRATADTRKQAVLSMQGHETILLVEDDEYILEYIKTELENSGYKVIATTNPMSAIDTYSRMMKDISLVITDFVMPLIDGRELMKRIAEINPRARFLAISEHHQRTKRGDDITPDFFLQKPFEAVDMLAAVRQIIDVGRTLKSK